MLKEKILILVLNSLPNSFWTQHVQKGFEGELRVSKVEYSLDIHYLHGESQESILKGIDEKKPNLVLLVNEPNDPSIIPKLMDRKLPTFFVSIIQPRKDLDWIKPEWRKYQTGVFGTFNAAASLAILQKIVPVKSVGILATSNRTITNLALLSKEQINAEQPNVKVEIAFEDNFERWKTKAKQIANRNDAFIPLFPYDAKRNDGTPITQKDWPEAGDFLRKEVFKPMLAVGSMQIGGMDRLLGLVIEPEKLGLQAASQVYRFVKKKTPVDQIPMEDPIYHDLQIKRSEVLRLGLKVPEEISSIATIF